LKLKRTRTSLNAEKSNGQLNRKVALEYISLAEIIAKERSRNETESYKNLVRPFTTSHNKFQKGNYGING
jgi:hypothetical protein